MATRTSAGTATVVTITIFGILAVGFFITAVVFYSKMTKAQGELANLEERYEEIIATGERGSDAVETFIREARAQRRSLVDHLLKLSSADIRIEIDPARYRPADVPVVYGSPAKLTLDTGWTPEIPFTQTVADVLEEWRGRVMRNA